MDNQIVAICLGCKEALLKRELKWVEENGREVLSCLLCGSKNISLKTHGRE